MRLSTGPGSVRGLSVDVIADLLQYLATSLSMMPSSITRGLAFVLESILAVTQTSAPETLPGRAGARGAERVSPGHSPSSRRTGQGRATSLQLTMLDVSSRDSSYLFFFGNRAEICRDPTAMPVTASGRPLPRVGLPDSRCGRRTEANDRRGLVRFVENRWWMGQTMARVKWSMRVSSSIGPIDSQTNKLGSSHTRTCHRTVSARASAPGDTNRDRRCSSVVGTGPRNSGPRSSPAWSSRSGFNDGLSPPPA